MIFIEKTTRRLDIAALYLSWKQSIREDTVHLDPRCKWTAPSEHKGPSVSQLHSSALLQTVMPCAKGLKNVHGTSMNQTTRRGRQKDHLCGFVLVGEISYDFHSIKEMT